MKATIKTFESGAGDCEFLILRDEQTNQSLHLMIDCNVLTNEIKGYIINVLNKRIDYLIITHVDSDHIDGFTKMLKDQDLQNLTVNHLLFNCFQPQSENVVPIPLELKDKLEKVPFLLPQIDSEGEHKTNGANAASFIYQLNRHPQIKKVWRKEPIVSGTIIPLGNNWGQLHFLSPTQEDLEEWFKKLKIEFASRTGRAPLAEEFENQEMYYELMSRIYELRNKKFYNRKNAIPVISNTSLAYYASKEAEENKVTEENKASLAFIWECGNKRVLFMGDAVSSTIINNLSGKEDVLFFEAIKIAHHGSKFNTSKDFAKKIKSNHYFLTGGKKGEGPHIEAISKYIINNTNREDSTYLHYNHLIKGEIIEQLTQSNSISLLATYGFELDNNNEYEFEC